MDVLALFSKRRNWVEYRAANRKPQRLGCVRPLLKHFKKEPLHPRNPHRGRYDFARLCKEKPALRCFVRKNPRGEDSIDFSDSAAVLCLNGALLSSYYGVGFWELPAGYLCPPIPGRADYIHHLADLLKDSAAAQGPAAKPVRVLDIGTGANCIYPILGSQSYGWQFVGSDIDLVSVAAAEAIVRGNDHLKKNIQIRHQEDKAAIFKGVIKEGEHFDLSMCNPPFHASAKEALRSNQRKRQNLSGQRVKKMAAQLNFSGTPHELWCRGGEIAFLKRMARESADFSAQVGCFSSLVSKSENIGLFKKTLSKSGASRIEVVEMRQGQKISRLVAWSFV